MNHCAFVRLGVMLGVFAASPVGADENVGGKGEASGEEKSAEKPEIRKVGEDVFEMGKIRFNRKTREIRFPAAVNLDTETILEFAVVNTRIGKLHESLLATDVRPFELQIVMKLLKYVPSAREIWPQYDEGKPVLPMKTDALGEVAVTVGWKDAAGKAQSGPIEEWIMNVEAKGPMASGAWIYTGSKVVDGDYLAELEGSLMAVYRTEVAMFNAFAAGSDSDEVWFPRLGHVPPAGTPVEVAISPRKSKE